MVKKINFLIILAITAFAFLGLLFLYNNLLFYKQANKADAIITNISRPDLCASYKGCYWSRKVTLSFRDSNNNQIKEDQELFTPTLVSGILTTGGTVKVLYKQKPNYAPLLDILVPNLGPPVYEVRIYSWHYWGYPILLIISGPILYFLAKRIQERTNSNQKLNT